MSDERETSVSSSYPRTSGKRVTQITLLVPARYNEVQRIVVVLTSEWRWKQLQSVCGCQVRRAASRRLCCWATVGLGVWRLRLPSCACAR